MKTRARLATLALSVFFLALAGPLVLSGDGAARAEDRYGGLFTETEKRIITDYFLRQAGKGRKSDDGDGHKAGKKDKPHKKGNGKGMPPGLAKRDSLPPGLAMQLRRHGTLPPGLAKRDLPNDLEARLPFLKHGQKRVIVDNDVLLIEAATGVILDVLEDVLK